MTDETARWKVKCPRGMPGEVMLTIDGKYHQSFYVKCGKRSAAWYARMLRNALRRLCPERESRT